MKRIPFLALLVLAASPRVAANSAGVSTAFTVDDRAFIPEGIAFDPIDRAFYLSSRHLRKIVRVDASGAVSDFITPKQDGIWEVMGIAVDARRRQLWAVSSSLKDQHGIEPSEDNRAGVFCFAMPSGKLVHRVVQTGEGNKYLDDLAVLPDGRVLVSDGGQRCVHVISDGDPVLRPFIPAGKLRAPQGIAQTPDGKRLFISDYAGAIWRVDPSSGEAQPLSAADGVRLGGTDGLAYFKGKLIAVYNNRPPHRVLQFSLNADETRIESVEVLVEDAEKLNEPTIGLVHDGAYYFVANSQGARLEGRAKPLAPASLAPPLVLKVELSRDDGRP